MKVAISGSSGKVCGAIVVQALLDGHTVVAIDVVEPAATLLRSIDETGAAARFSFSKIDMQRYDEVLEGLRGCDALSVSAAFLAAVYMCRLTGCVSLSAFTELP